MAARICCSHKTLSKETLFPAKSRFKKSTLLLFHFVSFLQWWTVTSVLLLYSSILLLNKNVISVYLWINQSFELIIFYVINKLHWMIHLWNWLIWLTTHWSVIRSEWVSLTNNWIGLVPFKMMKNDPGEPFFLKAIKSNK